VQFLAWHDGKKQREKKPHDVGVENTLHASDLPAFVGTLVIIMTLLSM